MVPAVEKMSKSAELSYWKQTGCGRGKDNKALGYRSAWIDAFIRRIWERFVEARRATVEAAAATRGISTQTGLMRLDGALIKVRKYIDDKFEGRAARTAGVLNHRARDHEDGRKAGKEAANRITLGQRGMNPMTDRKKIGG